MRGSTSTAAPACAFENTRWSLVLHARRSDQPRARQALEDLCRTYWPPLYAYVRRRGFSAPDAEDLTQEFFARLLARDQLAIADPGRGRFRSFLLGALKHFLANAWDRRRTLKRGGAVVHVPLDPALLESLAAGDPDDRRPPERDFERQWALALLQRVLTALEAEQLAAGRGAQFEALRITLTAPRGTVSYAALAAQQDMSEGALKVAVHRLRKRYRELLRAEIRDTVESDREVDDELRHLLACL